MPTRGLDNSSLKLVSWWAARVPLSKVLGVCICGHVVFFVERRVAAPSCLTGWDFRSGRAGTGKGLEVGGDVRPIFSRNNFAMGCGPLLSTPGTTEVAT